MAEVWVHQTVSTGGAEFVTVSTILLLSAVLAGVHWAAVVATIGLTVVGTVSLLFAVYTYPDD